MINLTDKQKEWLPVIKDYLSGIPRAVGRTYLLANAYIQIAIESKQKVYPIEYPEAFMFKSAHFMNHTTEYLIDIILNLWEKEYMKQYPNLDLRYDRLNRCIQIINK